MSLWIYRAAIGSTLHTLYITHSYSDNWHSSQSATETRQVFKVQSKATHSPQDITTAHQGAQTWAKRFSRQPTDTNTQLCCSTILPHPATDLCNISHIGGTGCILGHVSPTSHNLLLSSSQACYLLFT